MRYVVFDTETSGLDNNREMLSIGIISFCYDKETDSITNFKSFERFFSCNKEVSPDASAVNGLTKSKLAVLSGGCFLEDCDDELEEYLMDDNAIYTGYNSSFDTRTVTIAYNQAGLKPPSFKRVEDVMQMQKRLLAGTGYDKNKIKLVKAVDLIIHRQAGMSDEAIEENFRNLCGNSCVAKSHSALYDTFETFLILLECLRRK